MSAAGPRPVAPRAPRAAAALLLLASVASVVIWLLHAPGFFVFSESSYRSYWSRRVWMLLHVVAGTVPLMLGPFVLWTGLRRWRPTLHRWLGRTYLLVGALSVGAGAALSLLATLEPRGLYVATFTLAMAWFGAATMAYRAIRHRRIDAHRDWVMRSYVLTLTFVACRIVMRVPAVAALGSEAVTAVVWISWVVPLLVTEFALQWRRTGAAPSAPAETRQ